MKGSSRSLLSLCEDSFKSSKVEKESFFMFSKCSPKGFGSALGGKNERWMRRKSDYISPYLFTVPAPLILFAITRFLQLCSNTSGIATSGNCQHPECWDLSVHLNYSGLFPCSALTYIKARGRWMSDPCIWHLISAPSDLGFDWVSPSESLRKQSPLSSLNKLVPWCAIYLLWQFYYSEQWAFLVAQYFGCSLSSHIYKQKHSVW